jgi:hypothetical protein
MTRPAPVFVLLLVMIVLLAVGCVGQNGMGELTPHVTIAQLSSTHPDYVKMGSDVYNQGDIIKFTVKNEGSASLICWRPPEIHLYRQINNNS